jgi:hypothetical protein
MAIAATTRRDFTPARIAKEENENFGKYRTDFVATRRMSLPVLALLCVLCAKAFLVYPSEKT